MPTFKVTMLGDSGSGKTVFMASMYARLRDNPRGVSIRAINDAVDLELGEVMENLYKFNKWPPGSTLHQIPYEFELLLEERPVARIDWVDYRGGAVMEGDQKDGGSALAQRLRESDAILWMIDMNSLPQGRLSGLSQRIQTRVARMAQMCRQAVEDRDDPRAWIFVRTKADAVRNSNDSPDWERACRELIEHLGETVQIATSGSNSRAAVLPVSAVGRLATAGGSSKLLGDDPLFVEWPLLLSLAFLLDVQYVQLNESKGRELDLYRSARPGRAAELARSLLGLGSPEEQQQHWRQAEGFRQEIREMHDLIRSLTQGCPPVVKLLHNRHGIV